MFNNYYCRKRNNNSNAASFSVSEYAELKDVNVLSLGGYIREDKTIKPAFKRKNINYFHKRDLDVWWKENGHKVRKFKD